MECRGLLWLTKGNTNTLTKEEKEKEEIEGRHNRIKLKKKKDEQKQRSGFLKKSEWVKQYAQQLKDKMESEKEKAIGGGEKGKIEMK